MARNLSGKRVAVLVDNGFEQVELTSPIKALRDAGAEAVVVSPQQDRVKAWDRKDWGETFDVDMPLGGLLRRRSSRPRRWRARASRPPWRTCTAP